MARLRVRGPAPGRGSRRIAGGSRRAGRVLYEGARQRRAPRDSRRRLRAVGTARRVGHPQALRDGVNLTAREEALGEDQRQCPGGGLRGDKWGAMTAALFPLRRIVATPGALSLLAATATNPAELLDRHIAGDWSKIPPEDARENERSLKYGFRIVSSYSGGGPGERVWIIAEADRSGTCLLLPTEY